MNILLFIIGSIIVISSALLLVSLFKRRIANNKALALVNFLVFTSAVVFELVFVMGALKRQKANSESDFGRKISENNNAINQQFTYGSMTRRYEPYYKEEYYSIKKANREELIKMKEEGKISQEVYDKAMANAVGQKVE